MRFSWAILFVITQLIIFLLINAKNAKKQSRTLEESCFKTDFAGYHNKTMQK